ncbi:hypothetical protein COCNU_03G001250 [Cocos nucifera]|uniref:Uncharacterized protein n=1 Tax=Cocos nucifera TaxID=13894 RepID=A0A8K0I1U8_COCNU|nr:hypothetical protein COCNU_03G001250 [Cocos nucifera]
MEHVRFSKDGSALQLIVVDSYRSTIIIPNDPNLMIDILAINGIDISEVVLETGVTFANITSTDLAKLGLQEIIIVIGDLVVVVVVVAEMG